MEDQIYFPTLTEEVHGHAMNVYKPQIIATVQAERTQSVFDAQGFWTPN